MNTVTELAVLRPVPNPEIGTFEAIGAAFTMDVLAIGAAKVEVVANGAAVAIGAANGTVLSPVPYVLIRIYIHTQLSTMILFLATQAPTAPAKRRPASPIPAPPAEAPIPPTGVAKPAPYP